MKQRSITLTELLVASAIAVVVVGGAFALWLMAQDTWINERNKSVLLQDLQISIERIKREIQVSDGSKMFFHTSGLSLAAAIDDGWSDTGYNASLDGDGFLEIDSATMDPQTGIAKIYWDSTVIYHVFNNGTEHELRRTVFNPRDNSMDADTRQLQLDQVVALGTGNNSGVPNYANWRETRTLFKADSIGLDAVPKLRKFDGYSSTTERTKNMVDFGSVILDGGYHTIKFNVVDQNTLSSGLAFGIDSLIFTPPASTREAENYIDLTHPDGSAGISASSGDTATSVNMHESPAGLWSADYYLNYAADAINDYLTLRFYYDKWYETNFADGIATNAVIEFNNSDGSRSGASGSKEYQLRLEGNKIIWYATEQTNTSESDRQSSLIPANSENITYRNVIKANHNYASGRLVSIKFRAGDTNGLTIQETYIIQRDDSEGGSGMPYDGSLDMPSIPITFYNCSIDPRNQAQPTLPTSTTGADLAMDAGGYAWSNWIELKDNSNSPFNYDKTKDYLISFYVKSDGYPAQSVSYYEDPTLTAASETDKKHSFLIKLPYDNDTSYASVRQWSSAAPAPSEEIGIYGIETIDVTYVDSGTFVSQVFDTAIEDPAYGTMMWTAKVNRPDSDLTLRLRTNDVKTNLESDGDWSVIPGQSFSITQDTGSAGLGSIGSGRYIQFRAELNAYASGIDSSHITHDADDTYPSDEDFDLSCVFKELAIYWPGNTSLVDVGGYLTKRPDYGMFTVEIDGQQLIKGFEVSLSIQDDLTRGTTVTRSVTAEVEPRNTNK